MVYAEILAGGIGSRMGNQDLPKQFIEIKGKPIIIYTMEKFVHNQDIDKVIVCCDKIYHELMNQLIKKYFDNCNKIDITNSGKDRNDTMIKGCNYIKDKYDINDEDRIITIDAVRMFVSDRIINDNINMSKKYDAIGTFFPVVDTVMESLDKIKINSMPVRKNMYQAQAPQTFNIKKLIKYYGSLDENVKQDLTDVSKIFFLNNEEVHMVEGEYSNFKITYPNDINIALNMIENN